MVVLPRTWLISRAHSAYWDDQYHLVRGLAFLRGEQNLGLTYNDPPLGEALLALPMWIAGCRPNPAAPQYAPQEVKGDLYNVLFDQPIAPETILRLVALWKAVLFLPAAGVIFLWVRRLYGTGAAWLALAMVLIEPTIAAQIPPAALDVLGMEGILIACYAGWRFFQSPSNARLVASGVACAAAMLLKHTGVVVPIIFVFYALAAPRSAWRGWRTRCNAIGAISLVTVGSIWALTLFNVSMPKQYATLFSGTYSRHWGFVSDVVNPILERRWPGGIYIGSLFQAFAHGREGHPAFLNGRYSALGWWYYLPVVATYKVPIGIALVGLLGLVSLAWRKARREEWSILIPAAVALAFVMASHLSIGFRHALPAYLFLIMLASRAATAAGSAVAAWLATAAAALHAASYHPDYLCYINCPRADVALHISDSNLDWAQSFKQVRRWLDAHPQSRAVHVAVFADSVARTPRYYLGPDVDVIAWGEPAPNSGLLIVSPVLLAGPYDHGAAFGFLARAKPIDVIGHCMRVYDLDKLKPPTGDEGVK
jgi:hypothetical protein